MHSANDSESVDKNVVKIDDISDEKVGVDAQSDAPEVSLPKSFRPTTKPASYLVLNSALLPEIAASPTLAAQFVGTAVTQVFTGKEL